MSQKSFLFRILRHSRLIVLIICRSFLRFFLKIYIYNSFSSNNERMKNTYAIRQIRKFVYIWLVFYVALIGLTLDNTMPYKGDESFYIASSIHMLKTGNFMVPVYFGDLRFQKPMKCPLMQETIQFLHHLQSCKFVSRN